MEAIIDDNDCAVTECNPEQEAVETLIEGRNIVTNFGSVETFKERTKIISFRRPRTDHEITYKIKIDTSIKLVRENFELDHRNGVLKPNQDFELSITYKPILPSMKDVEIFVYIDNDNEIIKFICEGRALGPHCITSSKKLVFYKTPTETILEGQIEIKNDSLTTAYFKVERTDADIFQVKPHRGKIIPNKYQYLYVKFCPNRHGLFTQTIYCLIFNSEPLALDAIGFCGDTFQDIESGLKYYNFPIDQMYGFGAYLSDSFINTFLPFSLTSAYLDFGGIQINDKDAKTQVTSITNHMKRAIIVEWEKGTQQFKITPEKTRIPPKSSAEFEVKFNPDANYNIYFEILTAQIFWKSEKMLYQEERRQTVPMICTLRAQGHSFPEDEGWIAHIEVLPEVVFFQPCLPGETMSTTFMLRNKSHLPVLFKLLPPKKTNITAKPLMGKFRNFEIIVVQLQTEQIKVKTYIEEWKLVLNGRENKKRTVYFHGETSIPTIKFGQNNKINAGKIQDGAQKNVDVIMKNTSYFDISYKFRLIPRSILTINPLEGVLQGNDKAKITITISAQNQCAPRKEKFICEMHVIQRSGAISGETYETQIEIFCEHCYSALCAFPSNQDFENLPFGRKVSTEFQAINFGETAIYFQACQSGEDVHDTNFRIKPCFGEVQPKESRRFNITGIVSLIGKQTLYFGYYNRMLKDSPIVTGAPVNLFALSYFSEFPIIQIDEVVEHNFGDLFGKIHFFEEYLQILKFNNILREILNDRTEEIHLRLPDFEVQEKQFTITLALTNISKYDTDIEIQRKKICDCTLQETSGAGFTQRKKGYACPHRNTLSMELTDTKFYSKATRFLTINIKYTIPNKNEMCYIMKLCNHRKIEIYFNFFSIPINTPRISFYSETFKMDLKNIFIGTRVAPVQTYWMYNNTKELLNVEFDTSNIKQMCELDGFKVLEILNPIDQILPYSSKALLVKFYPIEAKKYSVKIDVKISHPDGEERSLLFIIEGLGDMGTRRGSIREPTMSVNKHIGSFPASLSIECINVKLLPVWNKRKKMIFIKNNFRDKFVQYVWGRLKIDNVIEVYAEKNYGLLGPKEVHPVILIINSFAEPCITNLLLPCEVVNYTDLIMHQITKEKHTEAQKRIDELMFDDQNDTPNNPITTHPKPETLYITLMLNITTVHSKDLDNYMDPVNQIRQYPNQSIENIPKSLLKSYYPDLTKPLSYPEKEKSKPTISLTERTIFCKIIEELISDVIFSERFKEYLRIYSEVPLPYYTDFIMDDRQIMSKKKIETPLSNEDIALYRKREIENFFGQPNTIELSKILQNLISESIFKMIQCYNPEVNLQEINNQIESTLYTCKKAICSCNKN